MSEFLLIAGMAAVTFAVRYPVLALVSRLALPPAATRALGFVPVAVLTAIIAPAMTLSGGELALRLDNAYLVAGVLAGAVAWRTRQLLPTILLGLAAFFAWRVLTG